MTIHLSLTRCSGPCLQAGSRSRDHDERTAFVEVYQLLEPGPVVLLTTAHKGRANVMAMSWHMMVEFEPPLIACVVSNADYSFAACARPSSA